ncbi:hypothetical protein Thermus77420_13120 [Thermus thalpophilus]
MAKKVSLHPEFLGSLHQEIFAVLPYSQMKMGLAPKSSKEFQKVHLGSPRLGSGDEVEYPHRFLPIAPPHRL